MSFTGTESIYTNSGSVHFWDRGFRWCTIYRRETHQNWSPAMVNVRIEYGIRFLSFRFTISRGYRCWRDGKQPKWEYAAHDF